MICEQRAVVVRQRHLRGALGVEDRIEPRRRSQLDAAAEHLDGLDRCIECAAHGRDVRLNVDRDERHLGARDKLGEIRIVDVWFELGRAAELGGGDTGVECGYADRAEHRDLVPRYGVRARDGEPQLVIRVVGHQRFEHRDPVAIDTDRGERVAQELLCVKAATAVAEIGPALGHEIDELLDLVAAAMLVGDRQEHELGRAQRDLRLLLGRCTLDAVEKPAQRSDRMRDRRGSRRSGELHAVRARPDFFARALRSRLRNRLVDSLPVSDSLRGVATGLRFRTRQSVSASVFASAAALRFGFGGLGFARFALGSASPRFGGGFARRLRA